MSFFVYNYNGHASGASRRASSVRTSIDQCVWVCRCEGGGREGNAQKWSEGKH